MDTDFHVSGHVNADGTVTSDEPVPLPAGPVEIVVRHPQTLGLEGVETTPEERRAYWEQTFRELEALREARGPVGKRKRMSDIDEDIYGPKAPFRE